MPLLAIRAKGKKWKGFGREIGTKMQLTNDILMVLQIDINT